MNETYVECMVARKKSIAATILKVVLYIIAGLAILIGLNNLLFFAIGLAVGAVAYFALPYTDLEYEYLYLDREITIDKIIAKQRRKRVVTLDLNKMEFMAPYISHEFDSYKNRQLKVLNFSSRMPDSKPYGIAYHAPEGDQIILFEPNEELIKAVRMIFPRKVIDY